MAQSHESRRREHDEAMRDAEDRNRVAGRGDPETRNAMRPARGRGGVNDPDDPGLNPPGRLGGVTVPGGAPKFIK